MTCVDHLHYMSYVSYMSYISFTEYYVGYVGYMSTTQCNWCYWMIHCHENCYHMQLEVPDTMLGWHGATHWNPFC
jgi:hypothetical protein